MDARERRLAENEALFREINEEVSRAASRLDEVAPSDHRYEFFCECSGDSCRKEISMTLVEYEAVRANATRFAVFPGHEATDVERVVERGDRYHVVEKHGEAAELVRRRDPRGSAPS